MLFFKEALNTKEKDSLHSGFSWVFRFFLLLLIIPIFVPFSPKMPAPGLDASWALGLNQAIAQGLSFGKEMIFTLGPYSAIYTKAYHPATDFMMIFGSFYLALSYWLNLILLMNKRRWQWIMAFTALICGMIYARDSLFFSYPLLAALNGFTLLNSQKPPTKATYLLFSLISAPLGLLALIKGSLLILSLVVIILFTVFIKSFPQRCRVLPGLLASLVSLIFFWLIAGQSLVYLPDYIISSIQLASGFSEAMAIDGDSKEIILYLLSSGLILLMLALQKQTSQPFKLFLLCIFTVFLFLSFKAGFTRHFGHSFITGTSLLIAALLLPLLFTSKGLIPVLVVVIYSAMYIDGQHTKISLVNNLVSTYSSSWYGFTHRLQDRNWVRQNYAVTLAYLKNQASLPPLKGKIDIYSYDQSDLIASDMIWSPRPIFQSYSVFTPKMAEKNRQHLEQSNRPDTIIFKLQGIDGRIPSLDDGISWPELLHHYQPTQLINDALILSKNAQQDKPQLVPLNSETHALGEKFDLPDSTYPLFVTLEIKPTVTGFLANLLFKTTPLEAIFELKDGSQKQYRLIATMAKSGFLLSPLIEDSAEFGLLYSQDKYLDSKKVKSLMIAAKNKTSTWQEHYVINYKQIIQA